ncbi:hypothetical protein [Clostridium chromiireducens]|uniref:hypothetical protein n=1 Tax=Clostridium chromiireducens TaxID=225345 RepID=UPI001365BE21|nr:hypothetical protein [Clostridium chromiireducens]
MIGEILKCGVLVRQADNEFWGLGLALTNVELIIGRVRAVPSCTGRYTAIIDKYYFITR